MKRILSIFVLLAGSIHAQTVLSGTVNGSGTAVIGGIGTGIVLTSITISPANPVVSFVGNQSFTAQGTYSNSTNADITSLAAWSSSNTGVATNVGPDFTCVARGTITVTANYQSVNGTTTLGCQSPTFSPQGTGNVKIGRASCRERV